MKIDMDMDMDMDDTDSDTKRFRCQISHIGTKFNPIRSDSILFSPRSQVQIAGSVRYRSSRTSDLAACVENPRKMPIFYSLQITASYVSFV